MEVVYRCCCGIDVHKKIIVACLNQGGEQSLREFGTTTSEIKSLATWLTESGCEIIAMESTGVRRRMDRGSAPPRTAESKLYPQPGTAGAT